jgi:hypothetical protein
MNKLRSRLPHNSEEIAVSFRTEVQGENTKEFGQE